MSPSAESGPLRGRRIVITGVTGQVAAPIARALAVDNDVVGLARFSGANARAVLEAAGVECRVVDLTRPGPEASGVADVRADVDHVLHFAVTKIGRWPKDLTANGEAVGDLMSHFRGARSFLHCSSTAVYRPTGGAPMAETDPLGDHHGAVMPTYSIAKIAGETMARFGARHWSLPTTIARLNVPYGDDDGWPVFHLEMMLAGAPIDVHTDGGRYNPIHHDDIAAFVPGLLDVADTSATTVNLAGPEVASIEDWSSELGRLVGAEPTFGSTDHAIPSAVIDTTRQHELIGRAAIGWREGMARIVAARS